MTLQAAQAGREGRGEGGLHQISNIAPSETPAASPNTERKPWARKAQIAFLGVESVTLPALAAGDKLPVGRDSAHQEIEDRRGFSQLHHPPPPPPCSAEIRLAHTTNSY